MEAREEKEEKETKEEKEKMIHLYTGCPCCLKEPIYPYLGKILERDSDKIESVERFDLSRFCDNCGKLLHLGFNPAKKYFCWTGRTSVLNES